jgi:hypothetical protein
MLLFLEFVIDLAVLKRFVYLYCLMPLSILVNSTIHYIDITLPRYIPLKREVLKNHNLKHIVFIKFKARRKNLSVNYYG